MRIRSAKEVVKSQVAGKKRGRKPMMTARVAIRQAPFRDLDVTAVLLGNTQIATILDLNPTKVSVLSKAGTLPKTDLGLYPLVGCVRAYLRHTREIAKGKSVEALRAQDLEASIAYRNLKTAKMSAALGDLAEMERDCFARGRAIQDLVEQLPARVAPRGGTHLGVEVEKLRRWLEDILHELAEGIVEVAKKVRAEVGVDDEAGVKVDDADADAADQDEEED